MPDDEETEADLSQSNSQTIYTGDLDLVLDAPVDLYLVSQLYDSLQTIPQLRILHTSGSFKHGARITITLEKPMPLLSMLSLKIPELKAAPVTEEKEGKRNGKINYQLGGEKAVKTIKIAFKK